MMMNTLNLNRNVLLKVFGIELSHWIHGVLWSIGVLIMVGLTMKDLKPIFVSFYDVEENTQLTIKIRDSKDTFPPPPVHFCLPLGAAAQNEFKNFTQSLIEYLVIGKECVECEALAKYKYDVWNRLGSPEAVDAFNSSLHAAYRENQHDDNIQHVFRDILRVLFVNSILQDGGAAITRTNLTWNRPLVFSLIESLLIEAIRERDLVYLLRSAVHTSNKTGVKTAERSPRAFYSVLERFVCEFLYIADKTSLYLDKQRVCNKYIRDRLSVVTTVTLRMACTSIPLDTIEDVLIGVMRTEYWLRLQAEIEDVDEAASIASRTPALLDYVGEERRILILSQNQLLDYGSYELRDVIYDQSASETPGFVTQRLTITYSVQSTVVEARQRKVGTCYREASKAECERRCWSERVESICACRLYAYPWRTLLRSQRNTSQLDGPSTKYCTTDGDALLRCVARINDILRTSSSTTAFDDGRACSTGCKDACIFATYQSQMKSAITKDNKTLGVAIEVTLKRHSYVEFTMNVLDSDEDFVSKIGGVFSFYLDWSGLSFIFFFVYLFDSGRRFVRLKYHDDVSEENSSSCSDQAVHELGWRWHWILSNASRAALTVAPESAEETAMIEKEISELKRDFECADAIRKTMKNELNERMISVDQRIDSLSSGLIEMSSALQSFCGR